MDDFLQPDLSLLDSLDLDRSPDREMVGGDPFLDKLRLDPKPTGQSGLVAEIFEDIVNGKRGSIHGKKLQEIPKK